MNCKIIFVLIFLLLSGKAFCGEDFDKFFIDKTLRIDYIIGGNEKYQTVFLKELKQEPHWGGSKNNLIDAFNYGTLRFKIFDSATGKLLYSRGFSSLFKEWQTTAEAKYRERAFYQVNIMPFPKNTVRYILESRKWDGSFEQIFEYEIDPADYFIRKEAPSRCKSTHVIGNEDPAQSVDVAFIAEGYTKEEMDKFRADVKRIAGHILNLSPFKAYRNHFNIYALETTSQESGTDIPGKYVYRNTAVNSSFYTFNSERYLTTFDIKALHDIAANVPYDQIFVLVNTKKYGGGGFYNYYTACSAGNKLSNNVAGHEFGHGFAGLGDEYYNSAVAYENFYNLDIEVWEPNLTTMVDFDRKWKDLIAKTTPVPTPRTEEYSNTIGVFEGGGYTAKGIYSPYQICTMKTNKLKDFCPVCVQSIEKMIQFYIGKK